MYFYLLNIAGIMHIQELRKVVPPPIQNIVRICKQITIFIFYYVITRMAAPFKFIYSSLLSSDVLFLTVHCKLVNFVFQIFLFLFLKCLLASHLTLFRLSPFISLGSCNHCYLACFL
jgi:hypothetical protein